MCKLSVYMGCCMIQVYLKLSKDVMDEFYDLMDANEDIEYTVINNYCSIRVYEMSPVVTWILIRFKSCVVLDDAICNNLFRVWE